MTLSIAPTIIEQVNALPYNVAVNICKRFNIGEDTELFKTIPLTRMAMTDGNVHSAVEAAYLECISSNYAAAFVV